MIGVKRIALVSMLALGLLAGCGAEAPATPTSGTQPTTPAQATQPAGATTAAPGGSNGYVAPGQRAYPNPNLTPTQ